MGQMVCGDGMCSNSINRNPYSSKMNSVTGCAVWLRSCVLSGVRWRAIGMCSATWPLPQLLKLTVPKVMGGDADEWYMRGPQRLR